MKPLSLAAAALSALVLTAGAADAREWKRNWSASGPHGAKSFQGQGSCQGGSCASNQQWSGPYGGSASRQGHTSCSGGNCSGGATYTGPNGQQIVRERSFSVK